MKQLQVSPQTQKGASSVGTQIARDAARTADNKPSVALLSYLKPQNGVITAAFRAVFTRSVNPDATASAIEELFDGNVKVVSGTMQSKFNDGRVAEMSVRLVPQKKIKAVKPEGTSISGFTMIAKNLYMDSIDKATWKLQPGKHGSMFLVRESSVESDADLEKLLASHVIPASKAVSSAVDLVDDVQTLCTEVEVGTMVSYVQTQTKAHKLGFVVDAGDGKGEDLQIVPIVGPVEKVSLANVVAAYDSEEYESKLKQPKVNTATAATDMNAMIAYYRKIYGMNEHFFDEWTKRMQQNAH